MSTSPLTKEEELAVYPLVEAAVLAMAPDDLPGLREFIQVAEGDVALHLQRAELAGNTVTKLRHKLNRLRREAGEIP